MDELFKALSEYMGLRRRLQDILKAYSAQSPEDIEAKLRRGEIPEEKTFEGYRRVYEDLADAISIQHELMVLERRIERLVERGLGARGS
ncbi:hypothetical protein B6U99_05230 [Candidatus Geothermarchaeota archaeon ex4572_27]|nr:MAG: hypothetical protein B6U99_05230 [Candidatus Geothermarchaeota archaeon ex4572_27]